MQNRDDAALWQVTWRVRGAKDIVVAAVQEHGSSTHSQELTEAEVMQQAVPAEASGG